MARARSTKPAAPTTAAEAVLEHPSEAEVLDSAILPESEQVEAVVLAKVTKGPTPLRWTRTDTASLTPGASVTRVRDGVWAVHVDGRDLGTVGSRERGETLVQNGGR